MGRREGEGGREREFHTLSSYSNYGPARRFEITKHPQDYEYRVPELFEATFPSKSTCAATLFLLPFLLSLQVSPVSETTNSPKAYTSTLDAQWSNFTKACFERKITFKFFV